MLPAYSQTSHPTRYETVWSFEPSITIVGLPDTAVQESRERVQAAIRNIGLPFPRKRIVVNLALALVRKEGPAYDLPTALGTLIMSRLLPSISKKPCSTDPSYS